MRGHVRFVSILCAGALSAAAFAEESSSDFTDSMRQPDGLYDATPHTRSPEISAWGMLYWEPGLGAGARYLHPILPDGFLEELNDSLELGGGADFYPLVFTLYGGMELDVPVEAHWTFHLMPNLAAYGMLSLGVRIRLGSTYLGPGSSSVDFWHSAGLGVIYRLNDKMGLQAELSYHGLRGGVGFAF